MAKDIIEKIDEMSDFLKLGVSTIDLQHEKFFKLLDELRLYTSIHEDELHFRSILQELEAYADYHFITEEQLMKDELYPDFSHHVHQHLIFKMKIEEFKHAFEYGNQIVNIQMVSFFQKWFVGHVCGFDKQFVDYIKIHRNHE